MQQQLQQLQKKTTAGGREPAEEPEIASFWIHRDDDGDEQEATLALALAMTEKELRARKVYLQFLKARNELEEVSREIQMLEKGDSSHGKGWGGRQRIHMEV